MKRKNLEKAIILGLMAASVSVPVWAADQTSGPLWGEGWNGEKIVDNGDNLIVNAGSSVGIGPQGTVNVINGDLTVNSGSNGIYAGDAKDATVNILANNVTINSTQNGIFTTWGDNVFNILKGYCGNVNIGSSDRKVESLYINAGGQGIDNKLGNVNIYGSKDSIISIKTDSTGGEMENQDGILNESGQVVIEGGNVIVSADYGYGINNNSTKVDIDAAGSVSIVSKDNPIDEKDPIVNAGINNTTGVTEITAEKGIFIDSTHDGINATGGTVTLTGGLINKIDADRHGIEATGNNTKVILNAQNNNIYAISDTGSTKGISVDNGAFLDIDSTNGYFRIDTNSDNLNESQTSFDGHNFGIFIENAEADIDVNSSFIINSQGTGKTFGIYAGTDGKNQEATKVNVDAGDIDIYVSSEKGSAVGVESNASDTGNNVTTNLFANNNIKINAIGANNSIGANASTSNLTISSVQGNVNINAQGASAVGLSVGGQGYTANIIGVNNLLYGEMLGIDAMLGTANITSNADTDNLGNFVKGDVAAIRSFNNGVVKLNATDSYNTVFGKSYGLMAGYTDILQGGKIELTALGNQVSAGVEGEKFGSGHAIKAVDNGDLEVNVALHATNNDNIINGVIFASGNSVNVDIDHNIINNDTMNVGQGNNYIFSSAHGSSDAVGDRKDVVAALYAQNQGRIEVIAGDGGINHIETSYTNLDNSANSEDSERTVWAQRGGVVEIKGTTIIKSSNDFGNYKDGYATNSRGVAITAGSGDTSATIPGDIRSTVNLEYGPNVTIGKNTFRSEIYGDIAAGYGGKINIKKFSDNIEYGLYVEGNALAANGGTLDMNLGEGGTWYGRADDYQDAGQFGHGSGEANSFFNPVFSNEITSAGTVNVTLGKGSKWYLTGQSWITTVNGVTEDISDAEKPVIDINNSNTWLGVKGEATSSALTIGTLNGNVNFKMNLDGNDVEQSDMLYIRDAQGKYDVSLNDTVTTDEINNGHDGLRFATVGKGSNAEFRVGSFDNGFFNVEYEVETDSYDGHKENTLYNGENLNTNKPGDEAVDKFFEDKVITTLNEITEDDQKLKETTNFKIVARLGEDLSEGGKTVVNMSKVNYSNAVYMDRLNKRLGEARYINTEEDQGMWVRIRHDRIGKDNEFRIMNTMYELGYDEKQECDNGERRVGAAIDYMDGSSEYTGVGGTGDVSRKGIWLYDTWMGDKGHYADYVAKWGHLSNDFTLYRDNKEITGDFCNDVYSISAEYGRKKDIGNDWYFEPQVQLQYARVTDANYTTSQGTEVSLDAINSLIARAGFRLGKDLGERSTVYFKADLLHEFLGDQDIAARDKTTDGKWTNVTYGNEGTWCDIGFGFATAMSKTSYAYLDVETSLGNDYEETYQINAGLQWSF